jgi:hypothetical protein
MSSNWADIPESSQVVLSTRRLGGHLNIIGVLVVWLSDAALTDDDDIKKVRSFFD